MSIYKYERIIYKDELIVVEYERERS